MFSTYFTHTVRPKKEKPDADALAAADAERERQRKEREVKFLQKAIPDQEHAALKVKAYEILGIKKGPDGNPEGYQRYGSQSRAIYWIMFLMRWVSEWIMRKQPIDELASDAGFANAANKEAPSWFRVDMIAGKRDERLPDGDYAGSFNDVFNRLRKQDEAELGAAKPSAASAASAAAADDANDNASSAPAPAKKAKVSNPEARPQGNVPLDMRAFFVEVSEFLEKRKGANSGSVSNTIEWFNSNLPDFFAGFTLNQNTCEKWKKQVN